MGVIRVSVTAIVKQVSITVNNLQNSVVINSNNNVVTRVIQYSSNTAGLSAYQVAVNNGFVGNEASWLLSLRGGVNTPYLHIGTNGLSNTIPTTTHNVIPATKINAFDENGNEVSICSHIDSVTSNVTITSNINLLNSKIYIT